jgi:integrase
MSIRRVKIRKQWRYQARVTVQGRRGSRLCTTRDAARDAEADDLVQTLKTQAATAAATDAAPATLRALFEAYTADLAARGKSPETIGRAVETARGVERLLPALLDRPVSDLGEADLFAFRKARLAESTAARRLLARAAARREAGESDAAEALERQAASRTRAGTKPSTLNRDLRTLRAMLKRALPDFRFPTRVFLPEDETRVRWLRPEEEVLLEAGLRPPFRAIAKLAALTLMRLSEIRLLRREMVHLEQGVILLPRAKAGARPVILSAEAQKILRAHLEAPPDSEWVFPGPSGRPYERSYVGRVFQRAATAAGLRDFHFHDLRHHGATMALNRGFTAPIVMALGGWKTERMMRRYAAVTDSTLRAAAEAVSGAETVPLRRPAPSAR